MKSTYTTTVERGILTSAYKREIRENIANTKSKSLSKIKSLVLNHHGNLESTTATILQVSLFAFTIIMIVL